MTLDNFGKVADVNENKEAHRAAAAGGGNGVQTGLQTVKVCHGVKHLPLCPLQLFQLFLLNVTGKTHHAAMSRLSLRNSLAAQLYPQSVRMLREAEQKLCPYLRCIAG